MIRGVYFMMFHETFNPCNNQWIRKKTISLLLIFLSLLPTSWVIIYWWFMTKTTSYLNAYFEKNILAKSSVALFVWYMAGSLKTNMREPGQWFASTLVTSTLSNKRLSPGSRVVTNLACKGINQRQHASIGDKVTSNFFSGLKLQENNFD